MAAHIMTSVYDDPTPCPLPRLRARAISHRTTMLGDTDPSVTLPAQGLGLRDARPRRPRRNRLIAGCDPTVNLCEDTFAFQKKVAHPPASDGLESEAPEAKDVHQQRQRQANRRTTIFAQPAQRVALECSADAHIAGGLNGKRRHVSTMSKQSVDDVVVSAPPDHRKDAKSDVFKLDHIEQEPRRRTIYIPSEDTTVMTIHPGRFPKERPSRSGRSRRSDIFLDLATLGEEEIKEDCPPPVQQQSRGTVSVKSKPDCKAPRKSLAAAPRRGPLENTSRSVQPQASVIDHVGQGGGKENVPPYGVGVVKRLGKRASLVIPEKPDTNAEVKARGSVNAVGLETISEAPPAKASDRGSYTMKNHLAVASNPMAKLQIDSLKPNNESLDFVRACSDSTRRESLSVAANRLQARRSKQSMIPSSLRAPRIPIHGGCNVLQKYPVLNEDISKPEMYEEDWLSHQEQAITQLINNLFQRTKPNQHRPSTSNQTLRQSLLELYHGPDIPLLHKRLEASLRFGALSIPSETLAQVVRFKDDNGQRQRFLELWTKTYTVGALEAASESVIGRQINTNCPLSGSPETSRMKSLSAFLKTFLVGNQDTSQHQQRCSTLASTSPIPARHGSATLCESQSAILLWRRTALRSLMLIHLLDKAPNVPTLTNPLFQPTSPYKSSTAVVQGLCRLLLPSIGDAPRILAHIGYSLTHVQYPLEEYSYPITNLATDLRDGIRITRLVESLLYPPSSLNAHADATVTLPTGDALTSTCDGDQSWPFSQHLKYPCISPAQRIYNTSIALAALDSVPEAKHLLQDLRPEDLVNGHREKTVRLLWGLVGRWGLEGLVDFELVRRETARLRRTWSLHRGNDVMGDGDDGDDTSEIDSEHPDPVEWNAALLKRWACAAARLRDVRVNNLSTSFADGRAFEAIAAEYSTYLPHATTPSSSCVVETKTSKNNAPKSTLTTTLYALGTSNSFLSLFNNFTPHSPSIASSRTVIPLLAFLASRMLPAARPGIAARVVQSAWRRWRMKRLLRRRVRAAVLARECRRVVEERDRLIWAVGVVERWWKVRCWV